MWFCCLCSDFILTCWEEEPSPGASPSPAGGVQTYRLSHHAEMRVQMRLPVGALPLFCLSLGLGWNLKHLLAALLLSLASLLHLARLFENQTFTETQSSADWWLTAKLCGGAERGRYLDGVLWESHLCWQLLSGVRVRVVAVRKLWFGVTERCSSVIFQVGVAFPSGLRQFIGANLVRVLRSAPGWRWFGFGAARLCGCSSSWARFCGGFPQESDDLHTLQALDVFHNCMMESFPTWLTLFRPAVRTDLHAHRPVIQMKLP